VNSDNVTIFASWDKATRLACVELEQQRQREIKRMLTRSQVDEIVKLYRDEKLGIRRIATLTGVCVWAVKKIVNGQSYVIWTGGRVSNGRRPDAVWRGGNKSYLESILEEC
jgi:hypothetical protein